jgi:hypothetical protein
MAGLSKSRILAHRQCPKRLWLQTYRPELAVEDASARARMAAGTHAGEVARTLYPNGVLIDAEDLSQALRDTAIVLAESPRPIFEATFQVDGVLVRADLLLPDQDGYRLAEVKSATSVKDYHLADVAVQTWVLKQAGVTITRAELAHIDSSFVYPGGENYQGLFTHVDLTDQISDLEPEVPYWVATARQTLEGGEPDIQADDHCHDPFDCPFLGYCIPAGQGEEGFPPEILPNSSGKRLAAELRGEGYDDLRNVPEIRLNKPLHRRIWQVTVDNQHFLDAEAGKLLRALPYPRYYLDFETIQFAVPIWAGTRPYEQIPFQWSCHIENANASIAHQAFLAEGPNDPRQAFAESLIQVLGTEGPILVYNAPFERGRMRELAIVFPDLAPALTAAIGRIVDLLPIARQHYYHPDMRGSWSIKAVLPTVAPDLAYDDLEVADGGMAMEAFAEILHPETSAERREQLRNALLKYCERDTWAMVKVAHYFQE